MTRAAVAPAKTSDIRLRLEPGLKQDASRVLASVGLELSGAIRLFLTQVVVHRGLPFEVRQPNAGTIRAMRQARAIASPRFASATELFDELEGRKDRKARRAAAKK